jgi:hypothetical protein
MACARHRWCLCCSPHAPQALWRSTHPHAPHLRAGAAVGDAHQDGPAARVFAAQRGLRVGRSVGVAREGPAACVPHAGVNLLKHGPEAVSLVRAVGNANRVARVVCHGGKGWVRDRVHVWHAHGAQRKPRASSGMPGLASASATARLHAHCCRAPLTQHLGVVQTAHLIAAPTTAQCTRMACLRGRAKQLFQVAAARHVRRHMVCMHSHAHAHTHTHTHTHTPARIVCAAVC